ncbi:MAG: hypothetical protein ACRCY8_14955 [Dermatophilaceae bacterium]
MVHFVDTSVLTNLLRVPGRSDRFTDCQQEFQRRWARNDKFVLPITSLIETGNFIAQCDGDRHAAATRFVEAIDAARLANPPWTVRDVSWDGRFLSELVAGNSTGTTLVDHFVARSLGAGDVSILVERDRFRAETAFRDVRVWTLDQRLSAYA